MRTVPPSATELIRREAMITAGPGAGRDPEGARAGRRHHRGGRVGRRRRGDRVATLTDREREVLDWVSRGRGNLQIARSLYLSEGAIKAHVSNLLRKLSCENRVQAAILAHDARLATAA
jgi:DNA-binding NarL/FixJ family response regulator